ncbi:MAG: (d)CMP kinase [Gammaproteobacteria bacterium]|nr:(d)CMP kinase [Gammaproteobacteria bacterium]MBI5614811.1 (d)CMP kinase [Gammaproteobacteria bacterium]
MRGLPPVIAIDGPSGTGKGTLAARVALELGWHLLDSGALYRLVGLHATARGVALEDEPAVAALAASLPAEFRAAGELLHIFLDGREVTDAVRSEIAGTGASIVAVLPAVRAALLDRQHGFRRPPGLVADGRDMGTVVFPDAPLKIFLTASAEVRAERRYKQLKDKGNDVNLPELLEDIRRRDERDEQRAVSPLKPAVDAVILDTTELGIVEVEQRVRQLIRDRHLN